MSTKKPINLHLAGDVVSKGQRLAKERDMSLSELVTRLLESEWETPRLPMEAPSPGYLERFREVASKIDGGGKADLDRAARRKKK